MFDKRLLALLGRDKRYVVWIVICNLLCTVCSVMLALSLCWLVNDLLTGVAGLSGYTLPFLCALFAVLLRFVLTRLSGHFAAKLGTGAKEMLRRRIYEKTARLGARETDELSLASLTQVGMEGVEQLDLYYSTYIPQFFYAMMSPFLLFILLMLISWPSAVVLLCCVPLIPMSIVAVSRYAKKVFAQYWGKYTKMGDAFLDHISGMKELKIFGADDRCQEQMNGEAEEFRKITMKVLTMQLASTTIMDLVAYGGAGLGIGVAVLNRMSVNPLFSMQTPALLLFVVLVAVDFFLPLRALGSAFHVSMNGATAGRKILTLLDTPEPVWGTEQLDGSTLTMEQVSFSYTPEREILREVSLEAKPGQLTAIVGLSGSGKSTILSLLSGSRACTAGCVQVGTKPLAALSREDYYRHTAVVSGDTWLFCDTIRNNFRMAKPEITDQEISEQLRRVELGDFTPEDLLTEGAANLSGGQRQRLVLAVNLAAEKDIYLFDEVTSNIDAESEEIIMKQIYALSKTRTVVMVSHRLRNFISADQIYVLSDRKLAESGTHEALLASGGLYSQLFRQQLAMEEGYLK